MSYIIILTFFNVAPSIDKIVKKKINLKLFYFPIGGSNRKDYTVYIHGIVSYRQIGKRLKDKTTKNEGVKY